MWPNKTMLGDIVKPAAERALKSDASVSQPLDDITTE